MKAFYAIFLLVFLASCGTDVAVETTTPTQTVEEQTVSDIDDATDNLPEEIVEDDLEAMESTTDETSATQSEVVVLDAPYRNPQTEVDMEIEYTLDADGKIETIDVSATTYDISVFNEGVQSVVGMTLEEASSTYISGASLTSASFNEALKEAM